jgi:uncharacterized protein
MTDFHAELTQMAKLLKALDAWLEKAKLFAESKSFDPAVLLQSRLAPDMYPLTRQIQAACDGVKFLAARVSGKDAPKHPDSDTFTLDELRARIRSVLEYTAGFTQQDFAGAEQRVVPLGFMPGKGILATDWVRQMSVPNTIFHLSMAYAILRHNGVALGKQDFIAGLTLRDL